MTEQPPPDRDAVGGRVKRGFDIIVAGALLVLLAPVMLVIAVVVRRDSPGPIIFRQTRAGLHGREFQLLKFRSMVHGADAMGSGLTVKEGDSRITRVGRFLRRTSLDELPQLVNVLRGDMSLVGPRPTIGAQIAHYTDEQMQRLDARPGITGLAQVNGRASLMWSQRIAYDVEYVTTWSMWRDLSILARTVLVVFKGGDTYRGEVLPFDLPPREGDDETGRPHDAS